MNRFIVYYQINPHFFSEPLKKMSAQQFFSTYKPVEVLEAQSLESVYFCMQGENWSPNGEMREFIRVLGLSHTSMSVGDVVYSQEDDRFYIVERFGFGELILTT